MINSFMLGGHIFGSRQQLHIDFWENHEQMLRLGEEFAVGACEGQNCLWLFATSAMLWPSNIGKKPKMNSI